MREEPLPRARPASGLGPRSDMAGLGPGGAGCGAGPTVSPGWLARRISHGARLRGRHWEPRCWRWTSMPSSSIGVPAARRRNPRRPFRDAGRRNSLRSTVTLESRERAPPVAAPPACLAIAPRPTGTGRRTAGTGGGSCRARREHGKSRSPRGVPSVNEGRGVPSASEGRGVPSLQEGRGRTRTAGASSPSSLHRPVCPPMPALPPPVRGLHLASPWRRDP